MLLIIIFSEFVNIRIDILYVNIHIANSSLVFIFKNINRRLKTRCSVTSFIGIELIISLLILVYFLSD